MTADQGCALLYGVVAPMLERLKQPMMVGATGAKLTESVLSIAQPIFGTNWTAAGVFVPEYGLLPVKPWQCASHAVPAAFVHDVCHRDTALAASSLSLAGRGRPKMEVHEAIQVPA